ncbi:hypothetical protein [Bradyrhizobium sp. AUGA SZCCT0160]|uniref:hypothetical protein n=1 Tax=Bradyrhizobium sp. AUGA SZCCT0160 TaxID=2807662 RepID=UPI001BA5E557|nr:hypothetical protein [Bradyrhizobium sp. AUGA SZCCT0160]MBR1188009.1 hypothetical protein [Bradyrhizobium sp. AUGA SZCCT0160]MBR1188256.1 hypothetical protein [Bradyrhizobium sp. AUGA SZCCT0160]
MQVTTRGWSRDHGPKPVLFANLTAQEVNEEIESFEKGETYFQIFRHVQQLFRGRRRVHFTARISSHAELNLNGSYLVQLELSREEIARLFYLTHGDAELPELIKFFSELRRVELVGAPREEKADGN